MVIDAFVVPYLDRSVGVVFWNTRRVWSPAMRGGRLIGAAPERAGDQRAGDQRVGDQRVGDQRVGDQRAGAPADQRLAPGGRRGVRQEEFAVYAPSPLSPGELAELEVCYAASLGRALREAPVGGGALAWWWSGGVAATVLLVGRSLEFGLGHAWLTLAAAVTALPIGAGLAAWPIQRGQGALARRLVRALDLLMVVEGSDLRSRERLDGLWQLARRLQGSDVEQLRVLEAHCREQAWPQAAGFYADQCRGLSQAGSGAGEPASGGEARAGRSGPLRAWQRRRAGRLQRRPGQTVVAGRGYAAMEMRVW